MRKVVRAASVAVVVATIVGWGQTAVRAEVQLPVRLRAFAVNMSNNLTGANGIIEIIIDKWSTPEERQKILDTVPKGQDDLVKALEKSGANGRLRIPGWTGPDPQGYLRGFDIHYAWREPLPDGGDRIVLALSRYMSMWELRNQPRSTDYPFGLLQIEMPKEGKGVGKYATFTSVMWDKKKNAMVIENYGTEPVRLNEITAEKP